MNSLHDLDRLLVTMDVAVQNFAVCEVKRGFELIGAPVEAIMVHYVLAGTMHMTIDGCEPIVCGPGCVVLVPPGLEPRMTADGMPAKTVIGVDHCSISRDGLLVFDAACGGAGDMRMIAGIVLASFSGSFGLLDKLNAPICEDLSDLDLFRHAYGVMLDEIENPALGSGALTAALMKTCLVMVVRRFFARAESNHALLGALAEPRLGRAVAAVLNNPSAPHTVESLATGVGMSRSTFARQFASSFAMSPMEFVAKTRLRHAADKLRTTNLPIKVIAASIGFSSRSHFSRAFRDAYGTDPSNFRQSCMAEALDAPRPLRGSRERFALTPERD